MCCKLKQNGKIIVPGDHIKVTTPSGIKSLVWGTNFPNTLYNARLESVKNIWLKKGYKIGTISLLEFYELNKSFYFTDNKERLVGIVYKDDHALVVTEPATHAVCQTHSRQPCYILINELLKMAS